ncbi:MAG: glutamine--fructose-6-phosphate transaminase (isomerizing) [Candidatus Dormibacteraeota bacterium]|uniref:Glutamine--fructose-6-phosphate aminotransferase [isomerizing] n=1 Tax=Candidatus Amunia macphersoniae TaxID=3127014 RepID=A0A934NGS9_9BACT|nr:glutamine--fructose-6-phosphate transaminase (isomerizing) [Candidatus Dormibacteraeota bacterium]
MCGIIGYSGRRLAAPVLLDSLERLEYRGYDSAGIAVLDEAGGATAVAKSNRKVADLVRQFDTDGMPPGHTGIGHTRWATHGRPTVLNAHPHRDCTGRIHLIHNGIIENYRELRAELLAAGHEFLSDTDTEVVPHLIEQHYSGDLARAVRTALQRITGAYALVVMSADEPGLIVGARLNAPLVVGLGDDEVFVSSDITALIPYTKRVILLGEGEVASASPQEVVITSLDGTRVEPRIVVVDWEAEQAQKDGFPHFMLKEIHEQPQSLDGALRGRIDDSGFVDLPDVALDDDHLAALDQVTIVACGSAWIAGMVTRYAIEKLARVRCDVQAASEFRYGDPLVDERSLVVAYSQSGETADTLAAVREARRRGATVVAVTNVVGSALSMEADGVIYMQSGPEICVAATKTMVNQMACGLLLALRLGQARGTLDDEEHRRLTAALLAAPAQLERTLALEPQLAEMAQRYSHMRNAMYIGRGINFPVALEGALKLKEVSYIHAEGYAAGELKHGPIALLDPDVPVVALATRSRTLPKMVSNIQEVSSRDAPVIALVTEGENPFDDGFVRDIVEVPLTDELTSPLINVVPLQLLAYHVAVVRGCDVDQPRNLAKSVTVE